MSASIACVYSRAFLVYVRERCLRTLVSFACVCSRALPAYAYGLGSYQRAASLFVAHFHEQEANGGEEDFSHTADDADEHADVGSHAHLGDGHGETTLSATQLERQEEKEVGKKTCKGKNQEGIDKGQSTSCAGIEKQEHKVDFETLKDSPYIFKGKAGIETPLVLRLKLGNLDVNLLEIFLMALGKAACPILQAWDVPYEANKLDYHAILVPSDEEIDAATTEAEHEEEHDGHACPQWQQVPQGKRDIDHDAGCPKPEVGKNVHHGEEQHAGSGPLCTDVGLQLHDFVGFAPHQSCRCGIVEGKARDGEFEDFPEGDRAVA